MLRARGSVSTPKAATFRALRREGSGGTPVEYGLLAAAVAVAVVATLIAMGGDVKAMLGLSSGAPDSVAETQQ